MKLLMALLAVFLIWLPMCHPDDPLTELSLKDYQEMVAPHNKDQFYERLKQSDLNLFYCHTGVGVSIEYSASPRTSPQMITIN